MEKFSGMLPTDRQVRIADVGSYDMNGTFKPLFSKPGWQYVGLDIRPGPNVDIVLESDIRWSNVADESFDAIISGSTMEHTKLPWIFIQECVRILKRGSLICINAPYQWGFHEHPIDCWRVFPDGMRGVLEWAGLVVLETEMKQCYPDGSGDTTGIARKPEDWKPR